MKAVFLVLWLPVAAQALTFEEFLVGQADRDEHRARRAYAEAVTMPATNAAPAGQYRCGTDYVWASATQRLEVAVFCPAAETERLPVVLDHAIEVPMLILQTHTSAFGVAIASDDSGDLVTAIVHQSPYNPAVARSNVLAAFSRRAGLRGDLRAARTNLAVVLAQATTNVAETRAIALSPAATAAQVRAAAIEQRRELIDAHQQIRQLAQEVQTLRRIVAQLVREDNP